MTAYCRTLLLVAGIAQDEECESVEECRVCETPVCREHEDHYTDEGGTVHAQCYRDEMVRLENHDYDLLDRIAADRRDGF